VEPICVAIEFPVSTYYAALNSYRGANIHLL